MNLKLSNKKKNNNRNIVPLEKSNQFSAETDIVLEMTHNWSPNLPIFSPLLKKPNSGLRIACILEDSLFKGLSCEGDIFLLTPSNWKQVLRYSNPDFLIMDSFWKTATGHWHMGQCKESSWFKPLIEIVELAKTRSIPTVYWFTKGHEYHDMYKDFLHNFEYIFCSDIIEAERLRYEGIDVDILLPCVQPAYFNPFKNFEHFNHFEFKILYDGWADLDRNKDELYVLKELKKHGLKIIESRYQLFSNRLENLPEFKKNILGCVNFHNKIHALKYAKTYLSFEKTLSSTTTQQWMTLEALASRIPVLHYGTLEESDLRKNIIIECNNSKDFQSEIVRLNNDDLFRERIAHIAWRKIFKNHTFSHRLKQICLKLGIEHDWQEYPKASLITPTFRREFIDQCIENFHRQNYPNKELIIIYNGNDTPTYEDLNLTDNSGNIKISSVPAELFAAACLNLGHQIANGDYFFRVDDDDYYGSNYIEDMIMLARCIDADLFGKPPSPISFENEKSVYIRNSTFPLSIIETKMLQSVKQLIGGNSISGKSCFFETICYNENVFGAADTNLLLSVKNDQKINIAIMDYFNLVAQRRLNQESHTWKVDTEKLKHNSLVSYEDTELLIC